jgi:hypothetical protein
MVAYEVLVERNLIGAGAQQIQQLMVEYHGPSPEPIEAVLAADGFKVADLGGRPGARMLLVERPPLCSELATPPGAQVGTDAVMDTRTTTRFNDTGDLFQGMERLSKPAILKHVCACPVTFHQSTFHDISRAIDRPAL